MPTEQLESLLENPAMHEAISTVFERSDGGKEELQWSDVSDALSSRHWGRLIKEGVLVSTGGGFALANPDYLKHQLEDYEKTTEDSEEIESESVSWRWYDKAAGVLALTLFAGYWNEGIRETVASFDNIFLAPVTEALPFYVVIMILSVVTGFYSTVLQSRLTDAEKMQVYRERLRRLRERKEAAKEREDEEALQQIKEEQREAIGDQLAMFKLQFRPTIWIMLLTIPVFLWLRWKVRGGHLGVDSTGLTVPFAGHVSWQESLFGPMSTWIVWYLLCSMGARQVIKKTLNLQTSDTSTSR